MNAINSNRVKQNETAYGIYIKEYITYYYSYLFQGRNGIINP